MDWSAKLDEIDKVLETYEVNHLPIIKSYADKIDLVQIINRLVLSKMNVTPGIIVPGMVKDTMSGRSPLYQLTAFMKNQDSELLLGQKTDPIAFNDDNVGRVLDKLYEARTLKIFNEISHSSFKAFNITRKELNHVHFDTTSKTVYGDYKGAETPFKITYAIAKITDLT